MKGGQKRTRACFNRYHLLYPYTLPPLTALAIYLMLSRQRPQTLLQSTYRTFRLPGDVNDISTSCALLSSPRQQRVRMHQDPLRLSRISAPQSIDCLHCLSFRFVLPFLRRRPSMKVMQEQGRSQGKHKARAHHTTLIYINNNARLCATHKL